MFAASLAGSEDNPSHLLALHKSLFVQRQNRQPGLFLFL